MVTGDTYIYATHVVPEEGRSRSIVVVFAPNELSGLKLGDQLRDFFLTNPLASELWLIAPEWAADGLRKVRDSQRLKERLLHAAALDAQRLIVFNSSGAWMQIDEDADGLLTSAVADRVRQDGLRVMFREGHGLMEAHAGLHYAKPSGSHTQHFLRAGPVVARSAHTLFVAAALLPWAASRPHHRICVDTNAIAGVGYALAALQASFGSSTALVPVDSYGGYERLALNPPDPSEQPLILISASTSGSMAASISGEYGIAEGDIMTLFYVGDEPRSPVLCDLTRRKPDDLDEYKIDPIESWSDDCPMCAEGKITIELLGEEFVPESATASSRMLKAVHSSRRLRSFIDVFRGSGAIRVARPTDAQSGYARVMNITLAPLLEDTGHPVQARVMAELKRHLPAQLRWIISLGDPDSNATAELAKTACEEVGLRNVEIVGPGELDEGKKLGGGHAFVVGGTIASGRSVRNISRQLRSLHDDHIHYFLVCAKPRSEAAWDTLVSDLTYGRTAKYYPLHVVWRVETEPDRGEHSPWLLELETLRSVSIELAGRDPEQVPEGTLDAVQGRIEELAAEGAAHDFVLLPASDYGTSSGQALDLNPNFAFWDDRAKKSDELATQDEVFFTMATVLHTFRYSADGRFALFGVPGHGYVLDPLNFGRFNDPIIQACILRAAKGVELDFRSHSDTSQVMADEILHLLSAYADVSRGGAAVEIALSIARGLTDEKSPGALRLRGDDLSRVANMVDEVEPAIAPLLAALLRYIQAVVHRDQVDAAVAPADGD
ncbi:hypothetical protein N3K63_03190 [Microbacterium sp. W1N]|uniref:hypothetical protein n=1 Tax=Microbacterium festucae TaxID=2977531 RepID=UPI0021BFCE22|nr:hypothetical protein [Microbacterium festucae]MCT9819286.1 hypothetical protein [Microbacterium festucae]